MSSNQKVYLWHKECEKIIREHNIKIVQKQKVAIAAAASAIAIWINKISKEKRYYKKKNRFG